ncbi:MAG: type II TA system antitoxin MqsA family protein [Lachnospiraceae bacterium]
MEKTILIKKIHKSCPVCNRIHEIEERKRIAKTVIKGKHVEYTERFYFCVNADEEEQEFETAKMTNENLLNARNAYREKMGLLTSDEIIAIRESYGLSQVDLAKLLGWGEATISRYESKAIQDEVYDMVLRLIQDNPFKTLEFLRKNNDKFSPSKQMEIKEHIMEKMNSYGKEFLARQSFEGEYVEFEEPSESNGYMILDVDKTEVVISYLAESVPDLYKTKLMRLLWYSDALAYQRTGKAMTGLVYRHENMGIFPIGHRSLMNLKNLNMKEEINQNRDVLLRIYPSEKVDNSILDQKAKMILDTVIDKFKDYQSSEMVDYLQEEKAYRETSEGDIIPFGLTKELRALG